MRYIFICIFNINDYILKYYNIINKIHPDALVKTYKVNNDTFVFLIDKVFDKKEENELKYNLRKEYFIVMSTKNNIKKTMNIIDIVSYLEETLPDSFILNDYLEYSKKINENLFKVDKDLHRYNKILIKADTLQTIGNMVNAPIDDFYNISSYKLIENECINVLEKVLNSNIKDPIISLLIDSINKRKVYELLKKVILKESNSKIILHCEKIKDYETSYVFKH